MVEVRAKLNAGLGLSNSMVWTVVGAENVIDVTLDPKLNWAFPSGTAGLDVQLSPIIPVAVRREKLPVSVGGVRADRAQAHAGHQPRAYLPNDSAAFPA